MQQKGLSYSDIQWIIEKLPQDIITTIIASYNPESLYILSKDVILKHDWRKQCQLTFNLNIPADNETEDWLRVYYNLSQRSKHKNIACGASHTVVIQRENEYLKSTSYNIGQLGLGTLNDTSIFTEVSNIKDIVSIACGNHHTIILMANGTLMSTGYNEHGQLGLGDTKDRNIFTEVPNIPKDVIAIACGRSHTIILRANGALMSTGNNSRSIRSWRYGRQKCIYRSSKYS